MVERKAPRLLHRGSRGLRQVRLRSVLRILSSGGLEDVFDSLCCMRSVWSSSIFHEPIADDRCRDVFPLPLLVVEGIKKPSLCRTTARRIQFRAHVTVRVNRAIDGLNSLFFGTDEYPRRPEVVRLDDLPQMQREAIQDIISSVRSLGAPPSASDSGALKALRVAASAYFEPEVGVGAIVSLNFSQLSLPKRGAAGVSLLEALDEPLQKVVENFESFMLRDSDVWTAISRDSSHLKPYSDPSLKSRSKYLKFLRTLHERGILSFTRRCRGRVGAFTVSKKPKVLDGMVVKTQRLVLDCRQTKLLFRPSPHTDLGSLSSLADMEIPPEHNLFISGADIQDCFYAIHIPEAMMQFFCLEFDISGADADWVSAGSFGGDSAESFSPCINVLPMGFSWSFYLV